jgi:hypothetical protein
LRATAPGEYSFSVKTRKETTNSVRARNTTCLKTKRAIALRRYGVPA